MAASATALEYVQKMYIAYFGRPVAPTGQEYYGTLVDAGNVAALQDDFWNSSESQGLFNQATTEGKVNAIFNQLFGRDALVAGLTYWTTEINAGRVSLPAAALTILNGAAEADLTAFNAKLAVAEAFTAELDTAAEVLAYQSNTDGGRTTLSAVTTEAQATAAVAAIATTVSSVVAGGNTNEGQSFSLTTSVDNLSGTSGNDTYTAIDEASLAAGDTLQIADAINGGAGTDTLNITSTQEGAIAALNLTSIENITIRTTGDEDNTGETFAATAYTGVERITLDRLTDNFGLTDAAVSTVVKIVNNAGADVDVSVGYLASAVTGTSDAATIEVDTFDATSDLTVTAGLETLTIKAVGSSASTIAALDIDGVTTLNLVGDSAALTITEADAGADNETTKIVVTGANKVTVTNALSTAVTTIDASAATGGSTFDLTGLTAPTFTGGAGVDTIAAVTADSTVSTGAGNDVVTLGAVVLGAAATIAGGEGTDTLVIGDDTTTLFTTATKARISGFETLRATGVNTESVDFDAMTGFTALELGANTALTVADVSSTVIAAGVNVLGVQTTSLIINATDATVPGTPDTLKLVLDHATADTAVTIADLQAAGVETLTVVSSGAGTNTNSIELGTENSTLANINISGASNFTLTTQGAADVGGVLTVAGGDATGVLTITLSGEDDGSSITTGSGADVITGGTVVDVISSGAGNDTLNISGGLDRYTGGTGVDSYKFAASYDNGDDAITIADFTAGVGGDKIMFDVSEMDGAVAALIDSLDMDAYVEGTVATIGTNTSSTAFASNSMLVITDASFANIAAVEAELVVEAGGDLTDFAVLFLNSTTGKAELYVSDTTADATNDFLVATFSNITTLTGIADFAAQNFTDF